jgi:DNA-binding XRE family transcriptional regulator
MADLNDYLKKRGTTEEQMDAARERAQTTIDAYKLREARKACGMTQVQMAEAMGVSQNRVSRMENGDIGVMSVDSVRRYVKALGGSLLLVADLPTGKVELVR